MVNIILTIKTFIFVAHRAIVMGVLSRLDRYLCSYELLNTLGRSGDLFPSYKMAKFIVKFNHGKADLMICFHQLQFEESRTIALSLTSHLFRSFAIQPDASVIQARCNPMGPVKKNQVYGGFV